MATKTPPVESLRRELKPGQLLVNPVELLTYEIDAAIDRGTPDGVVMIKTAEDVRRVVRWAVENNIPLVARGAGTGLSGGAVAEYGGIILEFSHMDRITEFDQVGRSVVVEPGVINLRLDETVKKTGLYYPPDPASGRSATIGGNIAENAGGPHCFKYGVTTNYLTGLDVVMADGKLLRLGGRAMDYPEYDLVSLITGSEGTLGLVTSASARLLRNPPALKTMMAAFDSVEDAGQAVSAIIARGLVPATLEMMDQKMMKIIEDFVHAGLPTHAGAALIIEVDGYPESLNGQMDEVVVQLQEHKGYDLRIAQSAEERDKIWYGRKSAAGAMARMSPSYYLLDGTVPRSRLAPTLSAINHICEDLELRVSYVFHAGDGNLHPFILIEDPDDKEVMQRVYDAGEKIMKICVGEGGSITGEHGVGIEKRRFMPLMYNAHELGAMRDVKSVLDPQGIFNPGKVFPEHMPVEELPPLGPVAINLAQPLEPRSAEEASDMIRSLAADGKAVRLRGGGTKSSLLSSQPAILSTRLLSGIRHFAIDDLYVVVGAGTPIADLQAELGRDKMTVPVLSPWPDATIGGLVSANFNAPLRMRYGNVRDLVMATTVVLPDGRLVRLGRPVVKNVAGYDLPKLFVGSHGTLGLITELALKLAPLPRAQSSLVIPVNDLSHGLEWGKQLLKVCLVASSLLLCRCSETFSTTPYTLLYTGEGLPEDVSAELAQARTVLQNAGAIGLAQLDQPDGSRAWGDWLAATSESTSLVRVGVAPKDLPGLLTELASQLDDTTYFADIASGQLYIQGIRDLARLRRAALNRGGYAILLGAPAGFAGISDPWGYAPESLELMRRIKARWDPAGLFNPGAFIV